MQISGKVIQIEWEVAIPKKDGGSYVGTSLTYKDNQGKVQTKSWVQTALNHAANAHIKATLQSLTNGSNFVAESVKNDQGFWNWTDLKLSLGEPVAQTGGQSSSSTTRSTYETPEERAERRALDKEKFEFEKTKQKLIIRQSSLANAVNYCKSEEEVEKIIEVARLFEAYVIGE